MNHLYATLSVCLTLGFLVRVVGQVIQVFWPVSFLPTLEMWQGSGLPYPILLPAQIVILGFMGWVSWRMAVGRTVFGHRASKGLFIFGVLYFLVMGARLVLGLTIYSDILWFASPIPASFHLVLAAEVMLISAYDRALAGRTGFQT